MRPKQSLPNKQHPSRTASEFCEEHSNAGNTVPLPLFPFPAFAFEILHKMMTLPFSETNVRATVILHNNKILTVAVELRF